MKVERITGIICFFVIIAALGWATILENQTEKRAHSAMVSDAKKQCEQPDAHGEYSVKANSGCGAKLWEVEGFLMKNGTVCVVPSTQAADDYGNWHCYTKGAL
jgi:hypothetical protein